MFKLKPRVSLQNQHLAGALGLLLVLAAGLVLLQGNFKLGRSLTRASYDWYFDLELVAPPNVQTSQVVMVYMDESSYRELNQPFNQPWDRALHARLLRHLTAAGAKAVLFDILFTDPGTNTVADDEFIEAIRKQQRVVLAGDHSFAGQVAPGSERIEMATLTLPYKPFREAAAAWGLAQTQPDEDFIVRQHYHGQADDAPSMVWAMAKLLGVRVAQAPDERLRERWVRYYGRPETIPHVSYSQALYSDGVSPGFFKDKVVIVGARPMAGSFVERRDELRSPYSARDDRFLFMPAVEVHATLLLNLIHEDWLHRPPPIVEWIIVFGAAALFGYGLCFFRPLTASGLALLGMTATTYIALRVFVASNFWFPWLILVGAQIPLALVWSVLVKSVDWYVQKRRMEAERYQAETRIREQAALLDKAQDAIFVIGLDSQVTYWNQSATTLLGWTREEIMHPSVEIAFLLIPQMQQARQRALASAEWQGEMVLTTKDGRPIVVQSRWTLVRDDAGIAKAFLVINTDITEQKKAEVRIQQQAALLDKAQDAIFVQNLLGKATYWNKSAERLYGWTREEILQGSAGEALLPTDDSKFQEARKAALEKGEWHGELTQKTKTGANITVTSRWTLVRDDAGEPESFLIINTDITEQKKLEAQFLRTQRMESIGTLAGGIAHDLNNVLSPILLGVELLSNKLTDDTSRKMLGTIETSAKRGRDMVKQVLTFARGHEGEKNLLQLSHLIKEMEKIVRETFPKNIQTQVMLEGSLLPVMGDATQLHQILLNLCVNARDAMPDGGEIHISARNVDLTQAEADKLTGAKAGSYVMLSVRDTGTGIPPEIIDKIFEPFFTTKEIGKGTGLGLSTVISIIKNHDGVLDLQSKVGVGTTFSVYLPAEKTKVSLAAPVIDQSLLRGQNELVLVVDDEPAIRETLQASLASRGYRVITATNGAEAIDACAQSKEKVSLVLIDMMMPVMSGSTAIRMLRRQHPEVKIIGMSGLMQGDKFQEQFAGKQVDFLPKPFQSEKLLEALRKALDAQPSARN